MKGNFERCLAVTLIHEGGWADDPLDPGGATMKGVTMARFQEHLGRAASKAELRAISDAQLDAIYRTYWEAVRGDDLPVGMDLVAFDGAVNSGPARGAKWLQGALGVPADGKIGPQTLAYARASSRRADVIDRACELRMTFLRGLSHFKRFGPGWTSRVSDIRLRAKAMLLNEAGGTLASAPPAPAPAARSFWQVILDVLKGAWK